jgi:hypothetical protein
MRDSPDTLCARWLPQPLKFLLILIEPDYHSLKRGGVGHNGVRVELWAIGAVFLHIVKFVQGALDLSNERSRVVVGRIADRLRECPGNPQVRVNGWIGLSCHFLNTPKHPLTPQPLPCHGQLVKRSSQ